MLLERKNCIYFLSRLWSVLICSPSYGELHAGRVNIYKELNTLQKSWNHSEKKIKSTRSWISEDEENERIFTAELANAEFPAIEEIPGTRLTTLVK